MFLSLGGLLSCGLEKSYYMSNIRRIDYTGTSAVIRLPSDADEGYGGTGVDGIQFDNFIIFYRIYISDVYIITGLELEGAGTNNGRSTINATLNADYTSLYPYTDVTSTSASPSNLETVFSNRRYFLLTLADSDGRAVELGSGSLGRRLDIAFPLNDKPTVTVSSADGTVEIAVYDLQRAVRHETLLLYDLQPQPNREFRNHPDLYNNADFTNRINADAVSGSGTPRYTYVSLYIAARGTNIEMPPGTVYSQPTFIGIFNLAES